MQQQVDESEALCTEVIIPQNTKQVLNLSQTKYWKETMVAKIQTMLDRKM